MPSYLVLARKYRPTTFGDVIGQDHVIRTLSNSIVSGRAAHAFLFCGVRGVGKTTVARILAKSLNCANRSAGDAEPCCECVSCREISDGLSVDVQEIDGASHTSVENIREINENIKYPPVSSPYKIIIIDEVHMISINAFNALLKTLEEPPAHAKFIFATTESHKVPATINSRCQRFNFRTISLTDIVEGMAGILEKEGIETTEEALSLIAREAQGSFRDGLSLLDQVIAFGTGSITAADVSTILGLSGREVFGRLMEGVLGRDPAACLAILHDLFHQGRDPEQFILELIHYVRNLIVVKTVPAESRPEGIVDAPAGEIEELEALAELGTAEELQNLFGMIVRSESEVRRSGNTTVALEMLVLRMALAPRIVDLASILERIDAPAAPPPRGERPAFQPARVETPPAPAKRSTQQSEAKEPEERAPKASAKAVEPDYSADAESERFVITDVVPLPTGAPDEVWTSLKERLAREDVDPSLRSIMDHGSLISYGPTEVEIGFTSSIYTEWFTKALDEKPAVEKIFRRLFGDAKFKALTLAEKTSLASERKYESPDDGETDRNRALKQEALENPIVRAVQREFEDSAIVDVKVLS